MSEQQQQQFPYGQEHVRVYRETGGKTGQIWKEGSTVLLLTTIGRRSGEPGTTPLIYAEDGDRYVIVASQGGAPEHPGWYRNLVKNPEVELQVGPGGVSRTGLDRRGRGARAAVAQGERGLAPLRRVRDQDRAGDPGGRAGAGVAPTRRPRRPTPGTSRRCAGRPCRNSPRRP